MAEVVTHLPSPTSTTRDECAVIALDNVSRDYTARTGIVRALADATFSIVAGEWVAITGPSGSGKSTLVNLIGCLDRPSTGTLKIDNRRRRHHQPPRSSTASAPTRSASSSSNSTSSRISRRIENVMLAQYFHSMTDEIRSPDSRTRARRPRRPRLSHLPSELSGGEQQRVCIARALINNPTHPPGRRAHRQPRRTPTSASSPTSSQNLHRQGHTIVMVTHDPEMAALAQRRIALAHGKVFCHPVQPIIKIR